MVIEPDNLRKLIAVQEQKVAEAERQVQSEKDVLDWLRAGERLAGPSLAPKPQPRRPTETNEPRKSTGKREGTNAERLVAVLRQRGPLPMGDARKLAHIPEGSMGSVVDDLVRKGECRRVKQGGNRKVVVALANQSPMSENGIEGSLAGRVLLALPASVDDLTKRFGDGAIEELEKMREEGLASPGSNGHWTGV